MADTVLTKSVSKKDLINETRYRVLQGNTTTTVLVYCQVAKVFERPELKKELAIVRVPKNEFFAGGRSLLADIVTDATRELLRNIKTKYPEHVR